MKNYSQIFEARSYTSIDKTSFIWSFSNEFYTNNKNCVILKKFENKVLYLTKITYDKTDFHFQSYFLSLDDSKKLSQHPSLEKERNNIKKGLNLETIVFDSHLEKAFLIYKYDDFNIEVNYVHFLAFLANNYRNLLSKEYFLEAAVITYFPQDIKPKKPKHFVEFLKENASNYGFFVKDVRGNKNIMFYTALDHLDLSEIKFYDYDFIISFDFIEPEQKNIFHSLDHIVLENSGKCEGLFIIFLVLY